MGDNPHIEQRMSVLENRQEKMEERQDRLEEQFNKHREEFVETRTYVRESYKELKDIRVGIETLKQHTSERIEQQGRHYRDEQRILAEQLRQAENRAIVAEQSAAVAKEAAAKQPEPDGSGEGKRAYDFAWKVVAAAFALATAVLGALQAMGGKGTE